MLDELTRICSPWTRNGEIQIEDKILDNYFVGIALPNVNLNSFLEKAVEVSNMTLSTMIQNLVNFSEEESVNKYYQDVILLERIIQKAGSNLNLYHAETGEKIMSQNEEVTYIKKLKYYI